MSSPAREGARGPALGRVAEEQAAAALAAEGWEILGLRQRTPAGEIDLIAERGGLLAFVEVKRRSSLIAAAQALGPRQRRRILAAAADWLARNPARGRAGIRFDVMIVDAAGRLRRIADAFREEE
ncbi:MAG: YraN family protein [Rhodovarius sp.]|nr:YraN family protein [Rhodovarius sp.]